MEGANQMKYVLTSEEIAAFLPLSPYTIEQVFKGEDKLRHFWAGRELRVISFPFLEYLKGRVSDETCEQLRQYIQS